MLGNYTTLLLNGSQHNMLGIGLPDKKLKYYPSLYKKKQLVTISNHDKLYVKQKKIDSSTFYNIPDEEIKNDGTAKFRLKDNILFCNHNLILKLTRKNVNYIISNCEIDKSDIKTPLIILKSKSGWRVFTLDSEQAKYSMLNTKILKKSKPVAKVVFLTDYNSNKNMYQLDSLNWNIGDIKIDFQANSTNLLDKLYNLQDFKCFTHYHPTISHPIV